MQVRFPLPACSPLLGLALLCVSSHGEGTARSDPQTEGERRLLEWDTTKKFVPSKPSFYGGSAKQTAYVPVSSFGTRSFVPKNSVSTNSFYTPEFLSPTASAAQKSFKTGTAYTKQAGGQEAAFNTGKAPVQTSSFSGSEKTSQTQRVVSDASRPYLGPEADKMKQKYTPQTGPKGGIVTGHQLSVEEVRAILNTNK